MFENKLVMVPGPTPVVESIRMEMGRSTVAHGDPDFVCDFRDVIRNTRELLDCNGQVFIIAGAGSLAMEMAVSNNLKAGDNLLVVSHGAFGDRFPDIASRKGINVDVLRSEWGDIVPVSLIEEKLSEKNYAAVTVSHVDTSTAVMAPIEEIGNMINDKYPDTLLIVDGVAATAGARAYMNRMHIDVLFTASQKAFGVAPGLAILWAGNKSLERRKTLGTIPEYYCDYEKWLPVMDDPALYFSTPPVNMVWAFKRAVEIIMDEGIEERYVRHERQGMAMREALKSMGFKLTAKEGREAPTLTNCMYMDGVDDARFRSDAALEGVTLAGALGEYKGKAFRIGHMGNADDNDMIAALSSVERALMKQNVHVDFGKGVGVYMNCMRK